MTRTTSTSPAEVVPKPRRLAADPPPLQKALRTIDIHITERIDTARLPLKAA
jgi:hypothetical protein